MKGFAMKKIGVTGWVEKEVQNVDHWMQFAVQ